MSPHECQDFCGVGTTWAMTLNRQSKDPCSRPSTRRGGAPLQHHLSRSLPAPRSSKATASSPTRKFSGSMIRSGPPSESIASALPSTPRLFGLNAPQRATSRNANLPLCKNGRATPGTISPRLIAASVLNFEVSRVGQPGYRTHGWAEAAPSVAIGAKRGC